MGTVLRIDVTCLEQVMRLPDEKFSTILAALSEWFMRTRCPQRDRLTMIGIPSFTAAPVVPPGRSFICRLTAFSCPAPSLQSVFTVVTEAHLDINWRRFFAANWTGQYFFHAVEWSQSPELELVMSTGCLCCWLWRFLSWTMVGGIGPPRCRPHLL